MSISGDVRLYICNTCKVLLVVVDKRFFLYERATMDEDTGAYCNVSGEDDEELDTYLCPLCSNTLYITIANDGSTIDSPGLSFITIPTSACKDVFKLHKKLKEDETLKNSNDAPIYEIGIPVNNPELKELLVEYLI